jgi:PPP family 3-phenylpropionic acid transporter
MSRRRDLALLYALGGAAGSAFLPYFALLLRERGFEADRIGVILAASSIAGVAAAPVWAHVADASVGGVRALRVSTLASAGAVMLLSLTGSSLAATLTVVVLLGAAAAPGTALADSLALASLGPERATGYGSIRLWASLGWAVAVLAFGVWFERSGLGPVVPAYAAGLAAYALALGRFPEVRPEPGAVGRSRLGSAGRALRVSRRLPLLLLAVLLVQTATSACWSFVPLRIQGQGGGPFLVGLAASLAAWVEIPFMASSAWLSRHVGLRALYVGGCIVYVGMMLGWAVAADPLVVALIRTVSGAGFGLTYVALVVITGRLVPAELGNTGQGLVQTVGQGIAPIVGSAAGGFVYRHLGPRTLFASAAVLTLVGAAFAWRTLSGGAFAADLRAGRSGAPAPPSSQTD